MSRIDFTPAQTTQIPTRASVPRSADSSKVSRAPRCTPPSPPVANTRMPARAARCDVAATVVARPRRAPERARGHGRRIWPPRPRRRAPRADRPRARSSTSPARIAIVAGTAPRSRTMASISRATRRLSGRGRPWAMIVLSSATTGRPSSRAARTSSCTCMAGHLRRCGYRRRVSLVVSAEPERGLSSYRHLVAARAGDRALPAAARGDGDRRAAARRDAVARGCRACSSPS